MLIKQILIEQVPSIRIKMSFQFSMSINYTQSVPFKLNPVLMSDSSDTEIWNFKLREMVRN